MHELYEELYNYLSEKHKHDPDFRFTTRITNRFGRLDRGYWFHGNDSYIAISFWTGTDWMNKTPNIYFCIMDTECFLMISVFDSEIKQAFVARELYGKIPEMEPIKGRYYKYYGGSGWQFGIIKESLDEFLKEDKPLIDDAISRSPELRNDGNNLGLIPEKTFNKWINNIERYRRTPRITSITVTTEDEKKEVPNPFKLSHIRINSFLGINNCVIEDIPQNAKCIFLTGENGTGKSSILKAIGTALTFDHKAIINAGFDGDYKVEIKLSRVIGNRVEEKDVEFAKANNRTDKAEKVAPGYASYGPYRLMTNHDNKINIAPDGYNNSLFHPAPVLYDIEKGLSHLPNLDDEEKERRKTIISSVIRDIIPGFRKFIWAADQHPTLYVLGRADNDELFEEEESQYNVARLDDSESTISVPYVQLASGAKNIISMVGDMIVRLFQQQPEVSDIAELQGIVLIDEIDIHLHPIFQKAVVKQLTDNFRHIQFVISTHSPIPLLGAPDESVFYVVKRNSKMEIVVDKIENFHVRNLTPNNILTSPVFGMRTLSADSNQDRSEILTQDDYEEAKDFEELKNKLNIKIIPDAQYIAQLKATLGKK